MYTILDEYRKEQNLCSVLVLRTPTLKGTGLNPAGSTNVQRGTHLSSASCFYRSEVMIYGKTDHRGNAPVGQGEEFLLDTTRVSGRTKRDRRHSAHLPLTADRSDIAQFVDLCDGFIEAAYPPGKTVVWAVQGIRRFLAYRRRKAR